MTMKDHVYVKVFLFVFNIFGYMFISLFVCILCTRIIEITIYIYIYIYI